MDDVTFGRNGRDAETRRLHHAATAMNGVAIPGLSLMSMTALLCFYRANACNATHGIAVAILSVRPSVRCVYCDKTKQRTANILIPHERAITLVF